MSRFKASLTIKMTVFILGGVLLVFAIIGGKSYLDSREVILSDADRKAADLSAALAYRIEQDFRALEKVPENLAVFIEIDSPGRVKLLQLIRVMVAGNREVYGSTVAFEPYCFDPKLKGYAPYYYKSPLGIEFTQLDNESYNYFEWDWYTVPRRMKLPVWSEPYYDEGGGGVLMCTYSVPFFKQESPDTPKRFQGVVTADISLTWLTDLIASAKTGHRGYAFLISNTGTFISHPDNNLIMKASLPKMAENAGDKKLMELSAGMMDGESGVVRLDSTLSNGPAYLAYTYIPSTGWSLAVLFMEKDLLAPFQQLNRQLLVLVVTGLVLLFLVILLISRSITRPLRRMAQAAHKVAGGDLDLDLSDLIRGDEVGRLAEAFSSMAGDLKQYIHDLTVTTAEKERIESELNIASQIQKSILPSIFPPFPDRAEFELHAVMKPARLVGGDFYDFFLIDDDRLALVMADVSGKGVPAALFMMISRTLIKTVTGQGNSPEQVLAEVNNILCQGNEASMFVTTFLAFYHMPTGRLDYANGGHNPAMVIDREGEVRDFGAMMGVALGCMDDLKYKAGNDRIEPGEILVLYTDGVTEAKSPNGDMFGEDGFKRLLSENRFMALKELNRHLVEILEDYQAGDQFDDITLLVLKRNT